MTHEEARRRVTALRDRRTEKSCAYEEMAAEYDRRADELAPVQREFLLNLGEAARRNAAAMREDAAALTAILETAP